MCIGGAIFEYEDKYMEMEQYNDYLSLYDYLGKAAGQELGASVNRAAVEKKVEFKQRHISNPSYHGNVHLYPVRFLDEYFKGDITPVMGDMER